MHMAKDYISLCEISPKHFCCKVVIGDFLVAGFVDEGSSSTMISKSLAQKLGLPIEKGKFGGFRNADYSITPYVGKI